MAVGLPTGLSPQTTTCITRGGDHRLTRVPTTQVMTGTTPYASPPDDSSEDEFSETLYSLVGDELMDPSVSAAEKEVSL